MSRAGTAVVDVVARCRRRIRLVSAVRRAGLTLPFAMVVVEIIVLAARPAPAQTAMLTGAAMAAAGIAAAIGAVLWPPTMRAIAAEVDARLHLQDRIVTALQVVDQSDPMAQLVLRDADARVATMSPRRAFPFEAPSHFRAVLVVAVSSTVVFLLITSAPGRSWLNAGGGANGAAGGGRGRSGRPAKPESHAQIVEGAAPSEARPRQATETAANRGDTPVGRESVRTETDTRAVARGSGPRAGTEVRTAAPGRDAGSAAGARDGGRGATAFSEQAAASAGGVNGALNLTVRPAPPRAAPAPVPADVAYRDQYRTASARAQAAIAQERVPARLRTYVRRYFVAIHP